MIGTIRRHQTWLWAIIVTLTVASFLVLGPTNTKIGNIFGQLSGKQDAGYGYLAGKPITRAQYIEAKKEVLLGYYLKNQQWPREDSAEVNKETYLRLFLIQQEKDMGIQVGTDAVAAFARRIMGPGGSLDEIVERVLKPAGMDANDFDHFLRHELGIEQLERLAGLSGKLVTPQEAETMYRLENQDIDSSIVYFSASNYLAGVSVTPDEIGKFYTNQMANYRVPDQVQVDYVKFPITNYTAKATASLTNLDQMVDNTAQQFGTNLYHGAKTPAESKVAIRNEIIRRQSILEARKAALAFAEQLDEMKPHAEGQKFNDTDALQKLAASNHMTVQTTAPFEREYGPSDITVAPDFTRKAFQLTQDDPFAGPLIPDPDHPLVDGVYVIALKGQIPSRVPPLQEIEAKVTADYRNARAIQAAQQAAIRFDSMVTNGLAQGKTFKAICADAAVKPEALPPFSISSRSLPDAVEEKVSFGLLKQVAFSTPPGKASRPAPANDGAFILYVDKVLPVDEAKVKQNLPAFLAYVRQAREGDAFNQWFNNQLRRDPDFLQTLQRNTSESQMRGGSAQRSRS